MANDEYVSVPAKMYGVIGDRLYDSQLQLQALWDAVYLTCSDKERLTLAYINRLTELRGGASPITMDVGVELEKLKTFS